MTSGLIINPSDLSKRWIDRMADNSLDVLGIHSEGGRLAYKFVAELEEQLSDPEYRALIDYAKGRGVKIEYELHAAGYLVPRELFSTHPEYFRMNSDGVRVNDWNFCITNPEALSLCTKRAATLASKLYGSEHSFYFWMDDGRDTHCACENCRKYSPSEQQLIVVNAMLEEIRKTIPDARMAYLAYFDSIVPPKKVTPSEGVFLEYAPFEKYTAVGEGAEEKKARERAMLLPLIEAFKGEEPKVLEYWFDNSIFSKRTRPPKKLLLDEKLMREDIPRYTSLGFKSITSFACFLGEDYYELWGDFDVSSYSEAIRLEEKRAESDPYASLSKNTVRADGQLKESSYIKFDNPEGKGTRVMFVGNSITLHGKRPEIGWNNEWGMAASAKEKDYVHLLRASIKERDPEAAFCICQVAAWEMHYKDDSFLLSKYETARDFGADVIILRFVENVPKDGYDSEVFLRELDSLVNYLDGCGRAKFVITTSFWRHPAEPDIRKYASKRGIPCIELSDLGEDDSMKAIGLFEHSGVANHPSDKGMAAIAERIMDTLKKFEIC